MAVGSKATRTEYGVAVLRVVVGIVFFMHGWQKFFDMGIAGVTGFFESLGIPAPGIAALVVSTLELVGGAMLVAGLRSRWAALLLAVDMLMATLLVHLPNGFFVSDRGFEFTLTLFAACVMIALGAAGRPSVDARISERGSSGRATG